MKSISSELSFKEEKIKKLEKSRNKWIFKTNVIPRTKLNIKDIFQKKKFGRNFLVT